MMPPRRNPNQTLARTLGLVLAAYLLPAVGCINQDTTGEELGSDCVDGNCAGAGGESSVGAARCKADDECDDGKHCNGVERCNPEDEAANSEGCVVGLAPCEGRACDEATNECVSCKDGDVDDDGHKAIGCDGDDCDDNDAKRFPGNEEVCDSDGIDEDCDFDTLGGRNDRDKDSDNYVDEACCNLQANQDLYCGNDCDDDKSGVNPGQTEACNDGVDDNCDDIVDGEQADGDLRSKYFLDVDGDGYGTDGSETLACSAPDAPSATPDAQWVDASGDCADDFSADSLAEQLHPGADEKCNAKDDDCDTKIDLADDNSPLTDEPEETGTSFACVEGDWDVTACPDDKLDCSTDFGCETDGTTISNCGECGDACYFACGEDQGDAADDRSCDELVDISAGLQHTCAVSNEGYAYCWGYNDKGQLGEESNNQHTAPARVSLLTGVHIISAGHRHTCATEGEAKTLYCWGDDASGQLGSSATSTTSTQPVITTLSNVVDVSAGDLHTCAVQGTGQVSCWGARDDGRLGDGYTSGTVTTPQAVYDPNDEEVVDAQQVTVGTDHTCVLHTDGTVSCFGDNSLGQLGSETDTPEYASKISSLTGVTKLSAGAYHTCAISGGKVYCWGYNASKQVGQTGAGPYTVPTEVPAITDAVEISAGFATTCVTRGATSGGALACWGRNDFGERGEPVSAASATPTVLSLTDMRLLTGGAKGHTCALQTGTNRAYCWGYNLHGELGNGLDESTHVVQAVTRNP